MHTSHDISSPKARATFGSGLGVHSTGSQQVNHNGAPRSALKSGAACGHCPQMPLPPMPPPSVAAATAAARRHRRPPPPRRPPPSANGPPRAARGAAARHAALLAMPPPRCCQSPPLRRTPHATARPPTGCRHNRPGIPPTVGACRRPSAATAAHYRAPPIHHHSLAAVCHLRRRPAPPPTACGARCSRLCNGTGTFGSNRCSTPC